MILSKAWLAFALILAGQPLVAATSSSPFSNLSLRDRIAQMIMVRGYGDYPPSSNAEYQRFVHWIRDLHVGGFIVAGRIRDGNVIPAQPFEMAVFINHMQRMARLPLLIGSDFERGASMRVTNTAKFPYMMAFGAARELDATRELGTATAREAHALGVTWVFAPDADVNNNPDNPIINTRSFGEDPQTVASNVAAFIEGAHSDPGNYVLVTAKHFPGHGDTSEDSHMQLARLDQPKERIESVELAPFRAAIQHGVDAVMTAHLAVPAFEPEQIPATLSRNVLTGLLRDELGFKGLVVTDAMEMKAVTSLYPSSEAAVRAVEAGADVLLMPTDPDACIRGIEAAVRSGRISRARINQSVLRILAAKRRTGLFRSRFVKLDSITDDLEAKKLEDLAQRVAERAFTLVKDEKHLFPLPSSEGACLITMTDDAFSTRGQVLAATLQRQAPTLQVYQVNSTMSAGLLQQIANDTAQCRETYVAAFITVAANRGSVALLGGLNDFMKTLTQAPSPVALISLGNPYLLRDFPQVSSYAATFSSATSSELAAAKAILGDIAISGKLPVSIPGFAKIGDGLTVPEKRDTASNRAQ
jgi:beta-N-acetylhexosaminidase